MKKNLAKTKIGSLQVLAEVPCPINNMERFQRTWWECRCDCGAVVVRMINTLTWLSRAWRHLSARGVVTA